MPRTARIDYPGARHHVMNRGARRQPVFHAEQDCLRFLELLGETVVRYGIKIHGYALMPNHFHLMVESVTGNLGEAMRHLGTRYSQAFCGRYGLDGPTFRGRYKNRVVLAERHWRYLLVYLHLNAVRARLATHVGQVSWSSHAAYAGEGKPPDWLTVDDLLSLFGSREAYLQFVQDVQIGRQRPPEGAEEISFSARRSSSTQVERRPPSPPALSIEAALEQVCSVASATPDELMVERPGRGGHAARVIAMWWLVHGARMSNVAAGRALGATPAAVSKALAKLRGRTTTARDRMLREWMSELRALAQINAQ